MSECRWLVAVLFLLLPQTVAAGHIRVLLATGSSIQLSSQEAYELRGQDGQVQSFRPGTLKLKRCGEQDVCAGRARSTRLHISSPDARMIQIDGKRSPPFLSVENRSGKLYVSAWLDVEVYLEGVLGREMSPSWPLEALKAQAVVARTYAWQRMQARASQPYDIGTSTQDQVFTWDKPPGNTIRTAIRETEGWILTADGSPIEAFFHADSGGHTAGSEEVWKKPTLGIRGVPDPWSPAKKWTAEVDASRVGAKAGTGRIKRISVVETTPSGRVRMLQVAGRSSTKVVSADKLRSYVGYSKARSTLFRPAGSNGLTLVGRGYGHGIGMSQTGAKAMAEAGRVWQDILDFYFPDTFLVPAE